MNSMMIIFILLIMIKLLIHYFTNFNQLKNFFNNIECGFNNLNNMKMNFSMNFMIILMIFILFDIELMLLTPILINLNYFKKNFLITNLLIYFMMMTTLMEMKNNKINWMI